MTKENLDKIVSKMDLDRTDEMFSSLIDRSKVNEKGDLNEDGIKRAKVVIASGNLHVATAKVQLGAIKLAGYRDNMKGLKLAVQKRARNARKNGQ